MIPVRGANGMSQDTRSCTGCAIGAAAVSRRDFVSQATLAAVALALTGCGGGSAATGPATVQQTPVLNGPLVVTLGNFPELARVGGVARVSSQPPIALARTSAGVVGYSLVCPHQGTVVDINGTNFTLRCPNHGAEFAFDGTFTGGAQQTSSLARLTVTPDATGATVTVSA
jgi:Rieske Fe-S protein